MSIFIKNCPECAQLQPVAATRCNCGYNFDAQTHGAGEHLEIEMIAEEERLYQEYLEARAAQARHDLETARAAQLGNPEDKTKGAHVLRAEQTLAIVQEELSVQSAKTQTAMATARKARETRPPKPMASTAAEPQAAGARLKTIPDIALTKIAAPAKPTSIKPPTAPIVSAPSVSTVIPPQKNAAAHRAKFAKPAPDVPAAVPNEAFRAAQAAKAEKALGQAKEAARAKMSAAHQAPQTRVKAQPSPAAPAHARAVPPLEVSNASLLPSATTQSDTKECPNCTATVTEAASRCRCGYAFPSGECELPGISLGAGELSILENGVNSGIGGRRS